ncbi:MAG TPA: hypothetical protein V6D29_13220 [Leptolyngbyaceae cyanobacterium]
MTIHTNIIQPQELHPLLQKILNDIQLQVADQAENQKLIGFIQKLIIKAWNTALYESKHPSVRWDQERLGVNGGGIEIPDTIDRYLADCNAKYLVAPRSLLNEMPTYWQAELYKLMKELDDEFDWIRDDCRYWVRLHKEKDSVADGPGQMVSDPLRNWDRRETQQYIEKIRRKRKS